MPRLRRSNTSAPGIRRTDTDPVRYLDGDGRPITDPAVLERIESLVIPPAWTDVWISPHATGHIQALGTDQAGRRQYIYHDAWRQRQDAVKFDRAVRLAEVLPYARRSVTRDLALPGFARPRAFAAAFRVVDLSGVRIGNEQYLRSNGSRGLTTLLCRHITLDGSSISFSFPAKSGKEWHSTVRDASLAAFLGEVEARRGPNSRLLAWREGRRWHPLTTALVNEDIRHRTHEELTAKDFRTLRGTVIAATALAQTGLIAPGRKQDAAISHAVKATAEALGNTPAVARASYIDPRIFDRYRSGKLLNTHRAPERALLELLQS